MRAILFTQDGFRKEMKMNPDKFTSVIALPKYPRIEIYTEENIDVSKPTDWKMLFYFKRKFEDENGEIVLIYEEAP